VFAGAAGMNLHKYFVRQSDDPIVWNDMGADKVELAALMRAHAKAGDAIWVSEALVGQPALQFLTPTIEPMRWVGEQALPFAERPGRNVVLGLSPTDWIDMAALERLYPNASYHVHRGPSGSPLLYSVRVPARDIAATRGVLELSPDGAQRRRKTFSTTGRTSARRRLVATLKVPTYGRYRFGWRGNRHSAARVLVDGQQIAAGASRPLAAGLHEIEVDAPGERGTTGLLWATSGSALQPVDEGLVFDPRRVWPVGLDGDYRVGDHFRGPARSAQRDPLIGMYFHRIPLGPPFTVEWSGHLYAPTTGRYQLGTRQNDTAGVYVDGRSVFSNTKRDELVQAPVRLVKGWHRLRIRYRAITGNFKTYLYWTPPQRPTSVVPSAFLRPTPHSSEFAFLPRLADTTGELRPGRLREADG
jgi:PA14 domain